MILTIAFITLDHQYIINLKKVLAHLIDVNLNNKFLNKLIKIL
jgi:hypothetical protein